MIDEEWNLEKAPPGEEPSTGVAEDKGQMLISMAVISKSRIWSVMQDADMYNQIMRYLYQKITSKSSNKPSAPQNKVEDTASSSPADVETPEQAPKVPTASDHSFYEDVPSSSPAEQVTTSTNPAQSVPIEPDDDKECLSFLHKFFSPENTKKIENLLEDTTLLICTDTGGQAAFLDLQSIVVQRRASARQA